MNLKLLNILVCPECKTKLLLKGAVLVNSQVERGGLLCENCLTYYPIVGYVPCFVKSDNYVSSFSYEWAKHSSTQLDSKTGLSRAKEMFIERTGFGKVDVEGKLVLDAGCGIGRFTEVVQNYGGHVVGVDMSFSVKQAYKNVGHLPNVDIVQADIMKLPFKEGSFDLIFSIGVLHHTYNTRKAFESLVRLLKKGGDIAIWVYSNDGWKFKIYNTVTWLYRLVTTRLPEKVLYNLCKLAIPLYYLHSIPYLGFITRGLLISSMEKSPEWRVLDTFDWFSAKYQFKHTYKEVIMWFYKCGLVNVVKLKVQVSVRGVKK